MADSDLVDIIDKNDQVIRVVTRKEMRQKVLLHRTTHFFLLNSNGEIFITKRSKNKDYAPGLWEIGQGGVLDSGEDYEMSAKRELKEELSIDSRLEYLFDFQYFSKETNLLAQVYIVKSDSHPKIQKEEIDEGKFVSLSELNLWISKSPEDFTKDSLVIFVRFKNDYLSGSYCKSGVVP